VATAALGALPDRCTVDGELICPVADGGLSFEALLGRMSRRLGGEPAGLMVFDLLVLDGEDLMGLPFAERRRRLEAVVTEGGRIAITPQSEDPAVARAWLDDCDVQGVEGVVAKRGGDPYRPGHRGWVKVKRRRTVECVVGGFRGGRLMLGLHDEQGLLHHVGETVPLPPRVWAGVESTLAVARGAAFTGRPPGVGRWEGDRYEEWTECLPRAVCEVAYTQLDGGRFRHAVRFVRWRPDREPSSCLRDQLLRP
jgi:ATP-dependent DNA ligase